MTEPKKIGRPAAKVKRNKSLTIRLTEQERNTIDFVAFHSGNGITDIIVTHFAELEKKIKKNL